MSLNINAGILSGVTQAALKTNTNKMKTTIQQLSTGKRINSAADDASGLTVSERLRAQINGLSSANKNAQDAISYLQVAEGGLTGISDILLRMRELSIEASNVTLTASDRKRYQEEMNYYKNEVDRTINMTDFNSLKIFSGAGAGLGSITGASELYFTGAPAEGSYTLNYTVSPGLNSVYTSNILTMNRDVIYADTNAAKIRNIDAIGNVDILNGLTLSFSAAATATAAISAVGTYVNGGTHTGGVTLGTSTINQNGYLEIEFLHDMADMASGNIDARVTFIGADGSQEHKDVTFTIGTTSGDIVLGGNTFALTIDADSGKDTTQGAKQLFQVIAASTDGFVYFTAGHTTTVTTGDNTIVYADYSDYGSTGNADYAWLSFSDYNKDNAKDLTVKLALAGENTTANGKIRLQDIKGFDVNEFANPQVLTIFGNNKSTDITVDKTNTVEELMEKIRNAVVDSLSLGASGVNGQNLVNFNDTMGTGWQAVKGSIFVQGAKTGSMSDLYFTGSNALMNALGFAQVQKSREDVVNATVTDSKGMVVSSESGTGMLRNAIQGVDIALKLNDDTLTVTSGTGSRLSFTAPVAPVTEYITVVSNERYAQLGANEGQYISITTPRLDSQALGLNESYLLSPDAAGKTLTTIDQALEKIGDTRATIGAQINAMTFAMQNQDNVRLPLEEAYSRITDADYGKLVGEFTELASKVSAGGAMIIQGNILPQIAAQLVNKL